MKTMRFNQKQNIILSEIYRKLNFFHKGNLDEKLMLLAYQGEVKPIMNFCLVETISTCCARRVIHWYRLTDRGKDFFSNYIEKEKLSNDINHRIFTKEYVKEFDYSLLNQKE